MIRVKTPARRMWLHVNDHVSGIHAALLKGRTGEAYNIAPSQANEAYTHDVIERVRAIVGKGDVEPVEDRKAYDLRIVNITGQVVFERHGLRSDRVEINRNGLESGMYFIEIENEKGAKATRKVVVQ